MKYVWMPISKGKFTLIDADNQYLFDKPWFCSAGKYTNYVSRNGKQVDLKRSPNIHLHRLIINCPPDKQVDHINGDGLDNRRENLRVVTASQNSANIHKKEKTKGVFFRTDKQLKKPWMAYIKVNYKNIRLGHFATEVEAAQAYNEAAIKYFGEFSCQNDLSLLLAA